VATRASAGRRSGSDALYRQVVDRLLASIDAGRIAIGDALPPEPELANRFSVSRHTVREALRILDELGIVDRRPGVGTTVKARRPQPTYVQVVRSPQELLQYPPSRLSVRGSSIVRADRKLAKLLQCRTGERWFQVQAVRRLRGKRTPICWLDLYLLPEYAGVLPLIGRRDEPVYEMVRRTYGTETAAVTVDLGVSRFTEPVAAALNTRASEPSFRVVRRYLGRDQRAFQISVSEHPANRYQYRLQLRYDLDARGGWAMR
jgi:DNA-binding GntR family transcriptional regulator